MSRVMKPNRRETIALLASAAPAALGLFSATGATSTAKAQEGKPNILFILVDNLGYGELGVYGGGATRGAPPHQHEHGGAVPAEPVRNPDRALRDPLRHAFGALWRCR